MDVVRLLAVLVALAIVATYVVVNNVPANIHNYVTQPISIINKSLSEVGSSVIMPNIELNAQGLSSLLSGIGNGDVLRIYVPSVPMNVTGGLTFEVPRIPTSINGTLGISVQSFNGQDMTLLITNGLNCTVVINNITGNYIAMNRQYTVPPLGEATVTLAITNAKALYQAYVSGGGEALTMNLTACGVEVTTEWVLGRATNVSLLIPNLGGGYVGVVVRNDYPFAVTLYNVTGRYITLTKPVEVPPNGTAIAEFHVWNYTGFYTIQGG